MVEMIGQTIGLANASLLQHSTPNPGLPTMDGEKRQYHRIRYPLRERPTFLWEGKSHVVIDVSARGLRYLAPGTMFPKPGTPVRGTLRFRHGVQINIDARVARVQPPEVALYLPNDEIPFAVLMAEQRYLHNHYPMWS